MQFNVETLQKAFAYSLSSSQAQITEATNYLKQASEEKSYIPCLLQILVNANVNLDIRQAAAVQLYRIVQERWEIKDKDRIYPEDREQLKNNILEALILVADFKKLHSQLQECMVKVACCDFPTRWPQIFPSILSLLQKPSNLQAVYGALLALLCLVKAYQYRLGAERQPLNAIVENSFETLEGILEESLNKYDSLLAAEITRVALKILFAAVLLEVPEYFKVKENSLKKWMVAMAKICESDVPLDAKTQVTTHEELAKREKNVYWANKKWSARILNSFLQRFGNDQIMRALDKQFAPKITAEYLVPFLQIFAKVLLKRQAQFTTEKYAEMAARYCYYSINFNKTLFLSLNNHLEELLFDAFLPLVYLNITDLYNWKYDPMEFVHRQEDSSSRSLRSQGIATISATCKKTAPDQEDYLLKFKNFAQIVLSKGENPRTGQKVDDIMIEAALECVGNLEYQISCSQNIRKQMEFFLESCVIPYFNSENGFIRAATCRVFGYYGNIKFENFDNLLKIINGIFKCLLDKELPVRVYAAATFRVILDQQKAADILRPHVREIVKTFLKIMEDIDNEHVVASLQRIIEVYSEEVMPFALDLLGKLTSSFFEYSALTEEKDQEDAKRAARECLGASKKLLELSLSQETYLKAANVLFPVFDYALVPKGQLFTEECIGPLTELLYRLNEIPANMWKYYLLLNYMLSGYPPEVAFLYNTPEALAQHKNPKDIAWGSDYIEEMVGAFQNYISKGRAALYTEKEPGFGLTLIDLLIKTIDSVYQSNKNSLDDDDDVYFISTLFSCVIENCPDAKIDLTIPIIKRCLLYLDKIPSHKKNRRPLTQALAISIWHNPGDMIAFYAQNNVLDVVMKAIFDSTAHLRTDLETKRAVLGLGSIFKLNPYALPQSVRELLPKILKKLIQLCDEILEKSSGNKPVKSENQTKGLEEEESDDGGEEYDDDDEGWGDASELFYQSPIEKISEGQHLKVCLQALDNNFHNECEELLGGLSKLQVDIIQKIFTKALPVSN